MSVQMRNYNAARMSHPISAQATCAGWGVDAWPLLSEPTSDSGPQLEFTRDVWDLDDDQLREVLEALHLEMARWEGSAPTQVILGSLRIPWGSSKGDMDGGKVDLKGRGDGTK